MKKIILILLAGLTLAACGNNQDKNESSTLPAGIHKALVKEIYEVPSYKYLNVEENGKTFWIAVRTMPVEKGDYIYFGQAMEMKNFESKTINKTFDSILFVNQAAKSLDGIKRPMPSMQKSYSQSGTGTKLTGKKNIKVEKVSGTKTIEEIYKNKNQLKGKIIKAHGVVTKVNNNIMGKNWIHIQDGTGGEASYDLLITTNETAEKGSEITVEGKLALDQDFGYGYKYELLLENGTIVK